MEKLPKISNAEWEVMKIIWENSPITASEVVEKLSHRTDWNPRTIKTMLNRLLKKGVLSYTYTAKGKRYLYQPLISREECVKKEGRHFLNRVFGGVTMRMLVHFTKEYELSPDEIEELKRLLDQKER